MAAFVKTEAEEYQVKVDEDVKPENVEAIGATKKRARSHAQSEPDPKKRLRVEVLADPFPHHKRPTPEECRVRPL
jgi:hypothetical protein